MHERVFIPLKERPVDWIILAFFVINLGFITYIVDLEQLVIVTRALRLPSLATAAAGGPGALVGRFV